MSDDKQETLFSFSSFGLAVLGNNPGAAILSLRARMIRPEPIIIDQYLDKACDLMINSILREA